MLLLILVFPPLVLPPSEPECLLWVFVREPAGRTSRTKNTLGPTCSRTSSSAPLTAESVSAFSCSALTLCDEEEKQFWAGGVVLTRIPSERIQDAS